MAVYQYTYDQYTKLYSTDDMKIMQC